MEGDPQSSMDDNQEKSDSLSPIVSLQMPATSAATSGTQTRILPDTNTTADPVLNDQHGEASSSVKDVSMDDNQEKSDSLSPIVSLQMPATSAATSGTQTRILPDTNTTADPVLNDQHGEASSSVKDVSFIASETSISCEPETLKEDDNEVLLISPEPAKRAESDIPGLPCTEPLEGDIVCILRIPEKEEEDLYTDMTIIDEHKLDIIGPMFERTDYSCKTQDSITQSEGVNSKTQEEVVDLTADGTEDLRKCIEIDSNDESDEPVNKRRKMDQQEMLPTEVIDLSKEDALKSVHINKQETDMLSTHDAVVIDLSEETPLDIETGSCDTISQMSVFTFKEIPKKLTGAWSCYKNDENSNYLKGCKWAPDGTCLMTNSNDNVIRVYNLPEQLYCENGEESFFDEMVPVLKMKEADTVYDYCWFPLMSSASPETACLAVSSKETPVHLYDAFTGDLRCSYRAYDHLDEIAAAHSISFDLFGNKLFCGFNKMIRVFDVTRPGRECQNRPTFAKAGQRGIISCIAHSPSEQGLYAAGSYSRSIALYQDSGRGEMLCMFEGQQGGVTQIIFSPDGSKLFSGGRKDNEIICWDLRNPGHILFTMIRSVETNQRMYFDITSDGRYIVSGCHDGKVVVWDTQRAPVSHAVEMDPILEPVLMFHAHQDTANGLSLHPTLPVIATASGQRHYASCQVDSDSEDNLQADAVDNSLKLWWMYPNKT